MKSDTVSNKFYDERLFAGSMQQAILDMHERNRAFAQEAGRSRTYRLDVYGCQMNERDAESCAGLLEEMGYLRVQEKERADIIVFVTCCIRENAEGRIYGHLGALSGECAETGGKIIAGGCMMQQKHVVEKIKKSYPQVRLVFGTHNIHRLPELLRECETSGKRIYEVWDEPNGAGVNLPSSRLDPFKAYVAITAGCNNFCSYCIVPHVRGRERSRQMNDVLEEVRSLALSGCKEITLLGQNVNSFGNDLGFNNLFADLLHELEKIEGITRVRFMTSHPKDLSLPLIKAIKDCIKVCDHLHLPVQSGSDAVLLRMNRKYSREQYITLLKKIRGEIPQISLSTDIIVGFPGETEEDFLQTMSLVKEVEYDFAFMFLYSPRKGTPAAAWDDQVCSEVVNSRFQRLLALQTDIATKKAEKLLGTKLKVLVEGPSKEDAGKWSGRTTCNRLVHFEARSDMAGKELWVRIQKAGPYWLQGELEA